MQLPVLDLAGATLIDTHCHLDMEAYDHDRSEVLERAFALPVSRIVTVGVDVASSARCVSLARSDRRIAATIGVHPHDVGDLDATQYRQLERLYQDNSPYIVAWGEIGLDYYRRHSPPDEQRSHLRRQLDLADDLNLPVVIHNRDADDDLLAILREARPLRCGGIMHCFSGDWLLAEQVLDLGLLISIPGVVTFKNSTTLQDVVQRVPLSSLVVETDGPYLAPQPHRGARNEPALLAHTVAKIAELRLISPAEVARQTTCNAEKLFHFDRSERP